MRRIGRWLVSALALMLLAACQITGDSPKATASAGANTEDVEFITNGYQLIMFDREEGALAQTQAVDPRVKALAAKLVADANRFAARLDPLAAAEGIHPPDILRYSLRVRLGHMQIQHGLDFDQTFLADQIASHQEAISMHEMMAASGGGSAAVRELAGRAKLVVQDNLRELRALQLQMMRK
jgi:predicted outer membrane protein